MDPLRLEVRDHWTITSCALFDRQEGLYVFRLDRIGVWYRWGAIDVSGRRDWVRVRSCR